MAVTLSVVIATYNRSEDLTEVLHSLLGQKLPNGVDFEVIIIDNNSNDDTKSVVQSYVPPFQDRLRYMFEPRQGKPHALNSGIKETKGEIIVLTDDDCTMNEDYLATIHDAFGNDGDRVDFIGGKCLPRWAGCSRPDWLVDLKPGWWYRTFFWGALAILDFGDKPFVIDRQMLHAPDLKLFHGANMAVRKESLVRSNHEFFKPPVEDVELQKHLLSSNMRGRYAPSVVVYHKISPERLTPQYFYRWYYLRGTLLDVEEKHQRRFFQPLGIQWKFILETVKLFLGSILTTSETLRIYRRSHALFNLGQMKQLMTKRV